ncbi:carboxypeptidase regulatory-like domain-containing protein, partial [bacterium]|nr:carboxypeptidase regulatory-like domain-containing protein [bacterium]
MRHFHPISTLLIVLFSILTSYAATNPIQVSSSKAFQVTELERSDQGLVFTLLFNEASFSNVQMEGDLLQIADIPYTDALTEDGYPIVPVTGEFLKLPPRGGWSYEIINHDFEIHQNIDYACTKRVDNDDRIVKPNVRHDIWYPESVVALSEPSVMHDFRIGSISFQPVQVNTARYEVRVTESLEIRISWTDEDQGAVLPEEPTKISEHFLPYYRDMLGIDDNELDEYELYRGTVQVVTHTDEELMPHLRPWLEWKRQKGFEIELISEEDADLTSPEDIRRELRERWQESEVKFDYIVMIGDGQGPFTIPPGINPNGNPPIGDNTDYYYTLMTLDDLEDVLIGRISISNLQDMAKYSAKVIDYELYPHMENTEWYTHGVLNAVTHYSGISCIMINRYWRNEMLRIGYTHFDSLYADGPGDRNIIINALNEGASIYSFRGGVGDDLGPNRINSLQNDHMLYFASDITCGTGNWVDRTSANEAHCRAGTVNTPKGGIAALGSADYYSNTGRNNALSAGAAYTLFRLGQTTPGDAYFGANLNNYRSYYGHQPNYFRQSAEEMSLMGDPTVWLWTAVPVPIDFEVNDEMMVGQNSLAVSVQSEDLPLAGAWVTFYKVDEEEEVIARGVSDSEGNVILNCPVLSSGTGFLTITAKNHQPRQMEITVSEQERAISYNGYSIHDDGEDGTEGNGNNIPEAGETIGIRFDIHNYGENTEEGVLLFATTTDPRADFLTNDLEIGTVNPGETEPSPPLLVQIAPETQQGWIIHLNLQFESAEGIWLDDFPLTVKAPDIVFRGIEYVEPLNPAETVATQVLLRNIGESILEPSTAILTSQSRLLRVDDAEVELNAIGIDEEVLSGEFLVTGHINSVPGSRGHCELIVTSETGQIDTLTVPFQIGNRHSSDPMGPDEYGYYAFDDLDTEYEQAPEYDWVELNPFYEEDYEGVRLDITDIGNNHDQSIVLDLPFEVQYYGNSFEQITINTNGWAALGSQPDLVDMRNYVIPSPSGPYNMLAAYWDERRLLANNERNGIFVYFDEEGSRYIIEWSSVTDYTESFFSECSFEIIIYDQIGEHQTLSLDNNILFQYGEMNITGGRTGGHGTTLYGTVGIEDGTQMDGIMYSYWNEPLQGGFPIDEGRAILFTTEVHLITGDVAGVIQRYENDDPLEGVTITLQGTSLHTTSDQNGNYTLLDIPEGEQGLIYSLDGFNTRIVEGIQVIEDEETEVNLGGVGENGWYPGLTHPSFEIDPDQFEVQMDADETVEQTFTITNSGNGVLEYSARITPAEGMPYWENLTSLELPDFESRYRAVAAVGEDFWVAGSNNNDIGLNKLYRFTSDGFMVGEYDQPVDNHSSAGFLDLTSDGEFLYGLDRGYLYKMQFTGDNIQVDDAIRIRATSVKGLAYDPDRNAFWVYNAFEEETLLAYDFEGEILETYEIPELNIRGLTYNIEDHSGFPLLINVNTDLGTEIYGFNPESGELQFISSLNETEETNGLAMTYLLDPGFWQVMTIEDGNPDRLTYMTVQPSSQWISYNPTAGLILPNETQNVLAEFSSTGLPAGDTIEYILNFTHNSMGLVFDLPLTVQINENEAHFEPVSPTEIVYPIVVNGGFVNGMQLQSDDEIAVFDGDLCVGSEIVGESFPVDILTYGTQDMNPGYEFGNTIQFQVYVAETEEIVEVQAFF